jgi:hypothetical protein
VTLNKALPLGIVFEYLAPFDTANDDMVQGTRGLPATTSAIGCASGNAGRASMRALRGISG